MTGNGLKFLLQPSAIDDGEERLTTARLAVRVDDEPVWPAAGAEDVSLEIQIDDLLSYLTEFWKPLALRQTYPIPVAPYRPMQLRVKAEERWENVPPPKLRHVKMNWFALSKKRMIFPIVSGAISNLRLCGCCARVTA